MPGGSGLFICPQQGAGGTIFTLGMAFCTIGASRSGLVALELIESVLRLVSISRRHCIPLLVVVYIPDTHVLIFGVAVGAPWKSQRLDRHGLG